MMTRLVQQVRRGEIGVDAALEFVAGDIRALTQADGAAIALRSEDGAITCRASVGDAPDVGVVLRPDAGLSGESIRTGKTIICSDTASDPRVDAGAAAALGVRSVLIVPIRRESEVVGLIETFAADARRFGVRHAAAVERFTGPILRLLTGSGEPAGEPNETRGPGPTAAEPSESLHGQEESALLHGSGHVEQNAGAGIDATAQEASATQQLPKRQPEQEVITEEQMPPFSLWIEGGDRTTTERGWRRVAIIGGVLLLMLLLLLAWRLVTNAGAAPASDTSAADATANENPEQLFARAKQIETDSGAAGCAEAMELLRRAAEAGHLLAQHELGLRYNRPDCGNADPAAAARWSARAAERGYPQAQREYASALSQGNGVPRDRVSSYAWYVLAHQGGDRSSEAEIRSLTKSMTDAEILRVRTRLGSMFAQGIGSRRDYVRAYMWFLLAETGGDESGRYLRESVQKQMTAEQIRQARTRAEQWLRRHRSVPQSNTPLLDTDTSDGENAARGLRPPG